MAELENDKIMRITDFDSIEDLELDDSFLVDGPSGTKSLTAENLYKNVAKNAVGDVSGIVTKTIASATNLILKDFSNTKDKVESLESDLTVTKMTTQDLSLKQQTTEMSMETLETNLQNVEDRVDTLETFKMETELSLTGLSSLINEGLGDCKLEQEGSNFYIIGKDPDPDAEEGSEIKQKIGSGDGNGEGGTTDYSDLENKPSINGVELNGNMSSADILNPINFGGLLPMQTYDGTQEITITFPSAEILNESTGTPVGEIISYMGKNAPPNYLICNGAQYNIADYPYLAQHFIDNFGSVNYFGGNGTTKFAVPDLRGEFLRGSGTASRNTGSGEVVGVHQAPTNHAMIHYHSGGNINFGAGGIDPFNVDVTSTVSESSRYATTAAYSSQYARYYTSRPTNTAVLYCIKYKPTYFTAVKHMYSYQEQVVGTWVDGKPLYEKTIDFGNLPNSGMKHVSHGISDVDNIWVYDGYVIFGNVTYNLTHVDISSLLNSWEVHVNPTDISMSAGINRTEGIAIITIRYTKTID